MKQPKSSETTDKRGGSSHADIPAESGCLSSCVSPLLLWYDANRRILPWREDPTPYHVWLSEIMLQQTRVEAVLDYYRRFLEKLPSVAELAGCDEQALLKLWEGLGYYSRVRNMQKAAQIIMDQYGGIMPSEYEEILKLPGIGSYTAGAIASIAFQKAVAAVDGNVLRVTARILADEEDIGNESLKKRRKQELEDILPKDRPGSFNQALMDLGATVCVPNGTPKCEECPLASFCRAHLTDRTAELPVKKKKAERRILERTVFVIRHRGKILLHRRPRRGLLAGLYELPGAEKHLERSEALDFVGKLGFEPLYIEALPNSRHIFSHLEWRMRAYLVRTDDLPETVSDTEDYLLESPEEIAAGFPIPSAFSAYRGWIRKSENI